MSPARHSAAKPLALRGFLGANASLSLAELAPSGVTDRRRGWAQVAGQHHAPISNAARQSSRIAFPESAKASKLVAGFECLNVNLFLALSMRSRSRAKASYSLEFPA